MELQRLVVENADTALTVDFHAGLTVAFHENPRLRTAFLADLLLALGPGRAGLHLELVDAKRRNLAVFRPHGNRHRVIDIDAAADASAEFRGAASSVDLLAAAGLDPVSASALMRVTANDLHRGIETGIDDDRRARLAADLDQRELWAAAAVLREAEDRAASACAGLGPHPVDRARTYDTAKEIHTRTAAARDAHRTVRNFGYGIALVCGGGALALWASDSWLDDNNWTAKALCVLAVIAAGLTYADRRNVRRAEREAAELYERLGVASFEEAATAAGPLTDEGTRRRLLEVSDEAAAATDRWESIAPDIDPGWAWGNREAIIALAERRGAERPFLNDALLGSDGSLADSARILVDRALRLRRVGSTGEAMPLILDEPFIGLGRAEVAQLLETVGRISAHHQVILVTGDSYIQEWAAPFGASGQLGLARIGQARPIPRTDPVAQPA